MAIKKRPLNADGSRLERRKSRRFIVTVPIEVSWRGADGIAVKQEAVATQVNSHGGFLMMSNYPELGARVTLANFLSAQTAEARVLAAPGTREGLANGIIVELIVPSESFWGVDLQVKKTSVELQNLEKALKSEAIDLRLLGEYREAVDYIRKAAGMVRQLRECHLRGGDEGELLSMLATERIRRTIQLYTEVVADLDAGRVKRGAEGIDDLYQKIERLCDRLRLVKIEDYLAKLGFGDAIWRSLNAAEESLKNTGNAFELKVCLGHLRESLEELVIKGCSHFSGSGETSPRKWEAATTFLSKRGVLSPAEEAHLAALHALVGDHEISAATGGRDYVRHVRNLVLEYSLNFLMALQRQSVKSMPSGVPTLANR